MKLKNLLKNKNNLQKVIFVGCLAMVVCLSGALVAQATQNSGYGYGYASQGYAYGYGYWTETTPSVAISYSVDPVVSGAATTITATFGSAPSGTPAINLDLPGTSNDIAYTAMSGSGTTWTYAYTATVVSSSTSVTVNIRTLSGNGYTPTPSNNTFTVNPVSSGGGSGGGGGAAIVPVTTTDDADDEEDSADDEEVVTGLYADELPTEPAVEEVDEAAEVVAETLYEQITGEVASEVEGSSNVVNFIAYGTSNTKKLGSGERAGVINSFKAAYGKLPSSDADWQDIIKISNGRWPSQTNQAAEDKASETFKKIYLRDPDMSNPNDNAAVTVMAYGLRPADRNLDSERAAIRIFKAIYGANPASATDWDAVRAIAYSGATR